MKRLLPFIVTCVFTASAFAQSGRFGVIAGFNESTYSSLSGSAVTANTSSQTSTSTIPGFFVGFNQSFELGQMTIQPAIIYTTKCSNVTENYFQQQFPGNNTTILTTEKQTLKYLEIPVNVLYNIPIKKVGNFFIGGGPYVEFGLSGKGNGTITNTVNTSGITFTSSSTTPVYSGHIDFGSGSDQVKTKDYGVDVLIGLASKKGATVSVGYGFGLTNLSNDASSKFKNSVLSLSLGYSFL
jgi:hypothetical protein